MAIAMIFSGSAVITGPFGSGMGSVSFSWTSGSCCGRPVRVGGGQRRQVATGLDH